MAAAWEAVKKTMPRIVATSSDRRVRWRDVLFMMTSDVVMTSGDHGAATTPSAEFDRSRARIGVRALAYVPIAGRVLR
jgi:hypothetical protein